jgi:hypothetical protein
LLQFYHSIHAKGEDVEEVLKRAEREDGENEDGEVLDDVAGPGHKTVTDSHVGNQNDDVEDGEVDEVDLRSDDPMFGVGIQQVDSDSDDARQMQTHTASANRTGDIPSNSSQQPPGLRVTDSPLPEDGGSSVPALGGE